MGKPSTALSFHDGHCLPFEIHGHFILKENCVSYAGEQREKLFTMYKGNGPGEDRTICQDESKESEQRGKANSMVEFRRLHWASPRDLWAWCTGRDESGMMVEARLLV